MSVKAINSINELHRFENTLLYGGDLLTSFEGMQNYCFGVRRMHDVLATSVSDESNLNEPQEIAERLYAFVESDMRKLFDKCERNCLSSDDLSVLKERMKFVWELYQVRGVPNLFNNHHVLALNVLMEEIQKVVLSDPESYRDLPAALKTEIRRGSPEPTPPVLQLPLFTRNDPIAKNVLAAMESTTSTSEPTEADIYKNTIFKIVDELERSDSKAAFDLTNFTKLETPKDLKLSTENGMKIFDRLLRRKDDNETVWFNADKFYRDERTKKHFYYFLKSVFRISNSATKEKAMGMVYDIYLDIEKELPNFTKIPSVSKDLHEELMKLLNSLGDHDEAQRDKEQFDWVKSELMFYLMVAPELTVDRLLKTAMNNAKKMFNIIQVFRTCISLFQRDVPYTIRGQKAEKGQPLLITKLLEILSDTENFVRSSDLRHNFIHLASSLCKVKSSQNSSDEDIDQCLVFVPDLLSQVVLPNLMKRNHPEMMLTILFRLFDTGTSKYAPMTYTTNFFWIDRRTVPACDLMVLIRDIYLENERIHPEIADISKKCLRQLGTKLQVDQVRFDSKSVEMILNGANQNMTWWIKYAIGKWFAYAFSTEDDDGRPIYRKLQIPLSLYKALPVAEQELHEAIVVDYSFNLATCYFASLFELGMFEPTMAASLARLVMEGLKPSSEEILVKCAISLVDTYQSGTLRCILEILRILVEALDIPTPTRIIDLVNRNSHEAVMEIQPILVYLTAVKIAMAKMGYVVEEDVPDVPGELSIDKAAVAQGLLENFSVMAKQHVDEKRKLINGISTHMREKAVLQLITQIVIFRNEINPLNGLINETVNGKSLRILEGYLDQTLSALHEMKAERTLDELPNESREGRTVYAFAKNATAINTEAVERQSVAVKPQTTMNDLVSRIAEENKNHPTVFTNRNHPTEAYSLQDVEQQLLHDETRKTEPRNLEPRKTEPLNLEPTPAGPSNLPSRNTTYTYPPPSKTISPTSGCSQIPPDFKDLYENGLNLKNRPNEKEEKQKIIKNFYRGRDPRDGIPPAENAILPRPINDEWHADVGHISEEAEVSYYSRAEADDRRERSPQRIRKESESTRYTNENAYVAGGPEEDRPETSYRSRHRSPDEQHPPTQSNYHQHRHGVEDSYRGGSSRYNNRGRADQRSPTRSHHNGGRGNDYQPTGNKTSDRQSTSRQSNHPSENHNRSSNYHDAKSSNSYENAHRGGRRGYDDDRLPGPRRESNDVRISMMANHDNSYDNRMESGDRRNSESERGYKRDGDRYNDRYNDKFKGRERVEGRESRQSESERRYRKDDKQEKFWAIEENFGESYPTDDGDRRRQNDERDYEERGRSRQRDDSRERYDEGRDYRQHSYNDNRRDTYHDEPRFNEHRGNNIRSRQDSGDYGSEDRWSRQNQSESHRGKVNTDRQYHGSHNGNHTIVNRNSEFSGRARRGVFVFRRPLRGSQYGAGVGRGSVSVNYNSHFNSYVGRPLNHSTPIDQRSLATPAPTENKQDDEW